MGLSLLFLRMQKESQYLFIFINGLFTPRPPYCDPTERILVLGVQMISKPWTIIYIIKLLICCRALKFFLACCLTSVIKGLVNTCNLRYISALQGCIGQALLCTYPNQILLKRLIGDRYWNKQAQCYLQGLHMLLENKIDQSLPSQQQ